MYKFLERYHDQISGVLSGFDRLVFHGTIRRLHEGFYNNRREKVARGMQEYLWENGILFKDYKDRLNGISRMVKDESLAAFRKQGLTVKHLWGTADKEALAKAVALERGITNGPVCALTAMEPGQTFEHRGTHMVVKLKPCPVVYHYRIHPEVGWMYGRIQTWFPFEIQIGMNGREWLSRQMDKAGIGYRRQGNCFVWIEDYARAQELMKAQLETAWTPLLGDIGATLNPAHEEIFGQFPCGYYWTCFESEWATDVVFREAEFLRSLAGKLTRHGMLNLSSADVMRYLGRRVNRPGPFRRTSTGKCNRT